MRAIDHTVAPPDLDLLVNTVVTMGDLIAAGERE